RTQSRARAAGNRARAAVPERARTGTGTKSSAKISDRSACGARLRHGRLERFAARHGPALRFCAAEGFAQQRCRRMNRPREGTARTALVTGASAGIGEALAREFAAHGFNLVLTARRTERLIALADELRRTCAVEARVMPGDLARP